MSTLPFQSQILYRIITLICKVTWRRFYDLRRDYGLSEARPYIQTCQALNGKSSGNGTNGIAFRHHQGTWMVAARKVKCEGHPRMNVAALQLNALISPRACTYSGRVSRMRQRVNLKPISKQLHSPGRQAQQLESKTLPARFPRPHRLHPLNGFSPYGSLSQAYETSLTAGMRRIPYLTFTYYR